MTIATGKPALILLVVVLLVAGVAVYVVAAGDDGVGAAESDGPETREKRSWLRG